MPDSHPHHSLPTLVHELVLYIRGQHKHHDDPDNLPPEGLARVFDCFSHHLLALALVARSDASVVSEEREVILSHCRERARVAGLEMNEDEESALASYVRH